MSDGVSARVTFNDTGTSKGQILKKVYRESSIVGQEESYLSLKIIMK